MTVVHVTSGVAKAAATPTDFYLIPSNRVVDIGIQGPIYRLDLLAYSVRLKMS